MENKNQEKGIIPQWYKPCIIVCAILMLMATAWAFIGLLNGSVTFDNEILPGNMFVYEGWMTYLFAFFAAIGFVWGIIFALKGLTGRDIKSVEISAEGTRETSDGCLAQLAGALISPLLFGVIGYALSYYLIFFVLEFSSLMLPYIIGIILIVLLVLYVIFVWCRVDGLKPWILIIMLVVALAIYVTLAIFLSRGVNMSNAVAGSANKIMESMKPKEITAKTFKLTPQRVGSLQLGRPFTDMSSSEEGLYNKVKIDSFEDPTSETGQVYGYELYWNDERVASFSLSKKGNNLDRIYFYSSRIIIPNDIHLGMPIREAIPKGLKIWASPDMVGESQCGIMLTMQKEKVYDFYIGTALNQEHFTGLGWQKIQKEIDPNDYKDIDLTYDDIAPDATLYCLSIQM